MIDPDPIKQIKSKCIDNTQCGIVFYYNLKDRLKIKCESQNFENWIIKGDDKNYTSQSNPLFLKKFNNLKITAVLK